MTIHAPSSGELARAEDLVTLTIDDIEVSVPKGTLLIRAAELIGIQIPRFCDHPLLEPVGACRQCLVEIPDAGNGRGMPKPQASCTIEAANGMVVRTQLSSAVADKAQQGIMEFLLANHPLDCPVCDKGGECPLQNQAMSNGRGESRFAETGSVKRTFPKPINISSQVLLDRERCVLCARCTRFSQQVAGDPFIELLERGSLQQVGVYEDEPFDSYFSGNTIQICPVGALTSAQYRFRSRPFDLVSSPSACEHCASGCALRTDHRRGKVLRRLAGDDPEVNEEWSCDKGRFAHRYADSSDRLTRPMIRDAETGELTETSWTEAFRFAAAGLAESVGSGAAVLTGGRVTVEDAYGYAKFARVALGVNDIDFRTRPYASVEEEAFLGAQVAGTGLGAGYADIDSARNVLLVGFEPEDESPIVFLRLRKAVRTRQQAVYSIASYTSRGLTKLNGRLIRAAPGTEAEVLVALANGDQGTGDADGWAGGELAAALRDGDALICVGERLAEVPGGLSAAIALSEATGARLAWIPRRAGERGALDAGCLPGLLPGGRPVSDPSARVDVAAAWGVRELPDAPGHDVGGILRAAADGELGALVVGGVEVADLPDPALARAALAKVPFVVSLEQRPSDVTAVASVVFPVAAVAEKDGTFTDWEGRSRSFEAALKKETATDSDLRVLAQIADEMGRPLGFDTPAAARHELRELGDWDGVRLSPLPVSLTEPPAPGPGEAVVASWRQLLDGGRLLDGEPNLLQTARPAVARVSAGTADELGAANGDWLTVESDRGSIRLPLEVVDLPDRVVWLPGGPNAAGGIGPAGSVVRVTRVSADPTKAGGAR